PAQSRRARRILPISSRDCGTGPMVVDDSRLIAVPMTRGGHMLGVLVGYCSRPGTFTSEDLQELMNYSHVAGAILANAAADDPGLSGTSFSPEELLHFSRLVTIG